MSFDQHWGAGALDQRFYGLSRLKILRQRSTRYQETTLKFPAFTITAAITALTTFLSIRAEEVPVPGDGAGAPVSFEFKFQPNDVYLVDKYQDIRIGEGGTVQTREERNKISLKVNSFEGGSWEMEGAFLTYSRSPRLVGEYRQDRDFFSKFRFASDGQYQVPRNFTMPNLQSLPAFADHPVKPGETWRAQGLETMELDGLRIDIPISVEYKYEGPSRIEDIHGRMRNAQKISYTYSFDRTVTGSRVVRRIRGRSTDTLWFDTEEGIPVFDRDRIQYVFTLADNRLTAYNYSIDSWYRKIHRATDDEKTAIEKDVAGSLEHDSNVSVRQSDQGVVLNMNDILFNFNSAELTEEAKKELERIAPILGRYPDHEIRISGHTDSVGNDDYNMRLSEERSRSVVRELQRLGVNARRLSYRGFGESRPVAPNTTPENRAKNRRVEILIVTE